MEIIFKSAVPAELATANSEAAIKALAASGMTDVNVQPPSEKFGKNIIVAGTPALPQGAEFMLVKPMTVNAKDRVGNPLTYDAFEILLSTGETRIVAIANLLQPWVAKQVDMTPKQLAMYEGHEKSLATIDAFHRSNDRSSIINSPSAGFTIEATLEARIAKFTAGVNRVEAVEQFDFTFTSKATGEQQNGRQRLYAFSSADTKKDIDAFTKSVKAAKK